MDRGPSGLGGRDAWDEQRGESRYGRGEREESRGRGSWRGDWRGDFRGPRGGWDEGRVSMDPREPAYESGSERSGWGARYEPRADWENPRGESARGGWGDGEGMSYGTRYGGGQGSWRGGTAPDSSRRGEWGREERSSWGESGTRGGFGDTGYRSRSERQGAGREGAYYGGPSYGGPAYGEGEGWQSRSYSGGTFAGRDSSMSSRSGWGSDTMRESHAGKGPKNYRRDDDRIREDVNERLKASPEVDASEIEVSISQGVVTLSGEVRTRREKRSAEDIAEEVSGVDDVTNQIKVNSSLRSSRSEGSSRSESGNGSSRSSASDRSSGSSMSAGSSSSSSKKS